MKNFLFGLIFLISGLGWGMEVEPLTPIKKRKYTHLNSGTLLTHIYWPKNEDLWISDLIYLNSRTFFIYPLVFR